MQLPASRMSSLFSQRCTICNCSHVGVVCSLCFPLFLVRRWKGQQADRRVMEHFYCENGNLAKHERQNDENQRMLEQIYFFSDMWDGVHVTEYVQTFPCYIQPIAVHLLCSLPEIWEIAISSQTVRSDKNRNVDGTHLSGSWLQKLPLPPLRWSVWSRNSFSLRERRARQEGEKVVEGGEGETSYACVCLHYQSMQRLNLPLDPIIKLSHTLMRQAVMKKVNIMWL